MKKLRLLRDILRKTGATRIWCSFAGFFLLCSLIIWIVEPGITTYMDAMWYCYAVVTTVGFGDILTTHFISRVLSVLLSIYAVMVIAIITGVVVNYYLEIVNKKKTEEEAPELPEGLKEILDRVERLPELSEQEQRELSERVKRFRKG